MPLPRPEPGLVIHYEYLWRYENERGEESGEKQRPCAIIVAVTGETGEIETVVAPITHVEPRLPSEGIEIPPRVKQFLGLDARRSWVIVTDLNVFVWPGIDIYPVPRSRSDKYEYGPLPPRLFDQIRDRITAIGSLGNATRRRA
jgi:hypothetical protein